MPYSGPGGAPRILLVRFSSIGDILLTTPLIRALRARHPGARIDALTKAVFAPLLADNPHLDAVLTPAPGETPAALAARLRSAHYTHRLDLHGSLRSRLLRLLLPGGWQGYAKHRVARALLVQTRRNHYPAGTPPVPERYFQAAPEVLKTLKAQVAANALELAKGGVLKDPFFLTGRVGGKAFSVHAEGERVILTKEGEERKEIDLAAPANASAPAQKLPEPTTPSGTPMVIIPDNGAEPQLAPGQSPLDQCLKEIKAAFAQPPQAADAGGQQP